MGCLVPKTYRAVSIGLVVAIALSTLGAGIAWAHDRWRTQEQFSPSELQKNIDNLLGRTPTDIEESDGFGYAGLIQCVFTEIEVEKKDRWFDATAPAFAIYPGETVDVRVRKRFGEGKETIHVTWDQEDDELKFCKRPGSGSCRNVRIDGRSFLRARDIKFDIDEEARGIASCRYAR